MNQPDENDLSEQEALDDKTFEEDMESFAESTEALIARTDVYTREYIYFDHD